MLDLCRREGLRAAVVVLPEGDAFRALYPPEALRKIDDYLDRLAADVPVIDARGWVGDDGFADGHHLLPSGASVFTARLAREALSPLLRGEIAPHARPPRRPARPSADRAGWGSVRGAPAVGPISRTNPPEGEPKAYARVRSARATPGSGPPGEPDGPPGRDDRRCRKRRDGLKSAHRMETLKPSGPRMAPESAGRNGVAAMVGMTLLLAGLLVGAEPRRPSRLASSARWFDAACEGTLVVPDEVARNAGGSATSSSLGSPTSRSPATSPRTRRTSARWACRRGRFISIFPSSEETVEESAEAFRRRVFSVASEGPEPLVIVAHSRGACDALAFALAEPAFVSDHVAALFFVQGAFGGTALADYVVGEGHPIDEKMPAQYRTFAGLVGEVERLLVRNGQHAGLSGLTRAESRAYWDRMLRRHAGAIPTLRPRAYFLRSATEPIQLGRFRTAIGSYLTTYDGPNDGIVALEDQYLPGVGTSLGVIDCGHGDLTCELKPGPAGRKLRRALAPCLAMAVGRTAPARVAAQ